MRQKLSGMALIVGIVAVSLMTPAAAQSGKLSGSFVVNGKKIPIQHVSAVTYDTPSQGRLISVLLSDKPPDAKMFREYTRIGPGERYVAGMVTGAWVTMHAEDKALSGLHFTIDAKQRVMLGEVLVGGRNNNFGILDEYLVLELKSVAPRLVGRFRTKDAVADLGSEKVGIDVTFDAPVTEIGK